MYTHPGFQSSCSLRGYVVFGPLPSIVPPPLSPFLSVPDDPSRTKQTQKPLPSIRDANLRNPFFWSSPPCRFSGWRVSCLVPLRPCTDLYHLRPPVFLPGKEKSQLCPSFSPETPLVSHNPPPESWESQGPCRGGPTSCVGRTGAGRCDETDVVQVPRGLVL